MTDRKSLGKLTKEELAEYTEGVLLSLLTTVANEHHDGHFTILKFTTNYKVAFGTPNLLFSGFQEGGWQEVQNCPGFATLAEAIADALLNASTFGEGELSEG